jgi:hypothetical protein
MVAVVEWFGGSANGFLKTKREVNVKALAKVVALFFVVGFAIGCGGGEENQSENSANSASGALYCTLVCADDDDCFGDGTCENSRCVYEPVEVDPCESDELCQAQFSGWTFGTECAAQDDCPGQVCVAVGDTGYCASEPSAFVDCETMMQEEIEAELIEDGETVTVCGNNTAVCQDNGVCHDPCQSDDDCTVAGYDTCLSNGNCGCGSDESCDDVANADTCYDGVCGCSSDDTCEEDNYVCE